MANFSIALGVKEVKDYCRMIQRFMTEFLGSFLYMCILLSGHPSKDIVAFTNGLLLASILVFTRPMSGGHLNPAITLGSLICGQIRLLPAILYIIAQIAGMLLGQAVAGLISTKMSSDKIIVWTDFGRLFDVEALKTLVVVAVALSVVGLPRFSDVNAIGALAIGISVAACLTTALDYRAMMNPAASLAVSIFHDDFSDLWVFCIAPLLGGSLAGVISRFILRPNVSKQLKPDSRTSKSLIRRPSPSNPSNQNVTKSSRNTGQK